MMNSQTVNCHDLKIGQMTKLGAGPNFASGISPKYDNLSVSDLSLVN